VLCNGVLHHTADPRGGFEGLVPLVKPGGYVVIGLYNRWGRLMTDLRRVVFKLSGGRGKWLDPYLRSAKLSDAKFRAWYEDQYRHPHESKHTIGEVLDWFDATGLEFVRGVPSVRLDLEGSPSDGLFTPERRGSRFDHFLSQLVQIHTGNREGGFYIMIGRKPVG
jgi:hypothetical protein